MGLRVKNNGGFGVTLKKYADRSTRQLRRVHRDAANRIADVSEEMAPVDTGDLEESIGVLEQRELGGRVSYIITYTMVYGFYMHEGVYNLGEGSLAKAETSEFRVGRKFLERAAAHVLYREGFMKKAYQAVRYK